MSSIDKDVLAALYTRLAEKFGITMDERDIWLRFSDDHGRLQQVRLVVVDAPNAAGLRCYSCNEPLHASIYKGHATIEGSPGVRTTFEVDLCYDCYLPK